MLVSTQTFAQLEKIETNEPYKTTCIENNDKLLASADIYHDKAELVFFEKVKNYNVIVDLTISEFKQLGNLVSNKKAQDKDFYMIQLRETKLFIRFKEKNGYVQSYIYLDSNGNILYFPRMNRVQYGRLFDM